MTHSDEGGARAARLHEAFRILAENPFRLLGLTPHAASREVEREGGKVLALIAAGLDDPSAMAPLGPRTRTSEQVRWAMAELRDPHRRALHEVFWPSCQGLPIDERRLAELLDRLPHERPGEAPLAELLRDLAGELVPQPPPFVIPRELASRLEQLAKVAPRSRAPEVCADALDLPSLFPLDLLM